MAMPRRKLKLTEAEIKNAKPKDKAYKLYDDEGLLLLVRPTGKKVWQYPYKMYGKYNVYTIGRYPEIGSAKARQLRDEARKMIQAGIAPVENKPNHRLPEGSRNSFAALGHEWLSKQIWVPKHLQTITRQLGQDVFHYIGTRPIRSVTRQEVLTVLQRIEDRGSLEVAKRTAQHCVQIFDYALIKGQCENNPATGLSKIIKAHKREHRPYPQGHSDTDDMGQRCMVNGPLRILQSKTPKGMQRYGNQTQMRPRSVR